jgi:hypothetical protein
LPSRLELKEEPRFADLRLGYGCNDLPTSRLSLLGRVLEGLHLAMPPDELRQPAPRRPLQPRA